MHDESVADVRLEDQLKNKYNRSLLNYALLKELGIALAFPPAEPNPSLAPPFCANQSRNWNMLAFGYRSSEV
jgi:hypothetical protein